MNSPLLLFPTAMEAKAVTGLTLEPKEVASMSEWPHTPDLAICGFGLPVAAALSSYLIHQVRPSCVFLLGIAGSYDTERAPIASVLQGTAAHVYGIGAGQADRHQSSVDVGFAPLESLGLAGARLDLVSQDDDGPKGEIISVTAAAATKDEAERNHRACPSAVMEDMESYAVALSAQLAQCPLTVIRAISNRVGDRDKNHWQIVPALEALRRQALSILSASK